MTTVQDNQQQEPGKYKSIDEWLEHGRQLHSAAVFSWVMRAFTLIKGDTTKVVGSPKKQQNIECLH